MKSTFVELTGIGQSSLNTEEINTEELKDNELIISNNVSMISAGTELSRAFAIKKGFTYPCRVGYCNVGIVLKKGNGFKDLQIGDRVFYDATHASLVRHACDNTTQGHKAFKIPDNITDNQAALINLVLIAMQGVNLSNVKLNDCVAVYGLGNIGIITCLLYQKLGCNVIGLDPVKHRCQLAENMGVKYTSSDSNQLEVIKQTFGKLADITVDVTGLSPVIISCIQTVKQYGQVVLLGSPRASYETDITPIFSQIHMKNLIVLGAFNQTCPCFNVEGRDDSVYKNFKTACELIANKEIDVDKLISHIIDPKDCEKAYYGLMYNKEEYNCVIFDWHNYKEEK